MHSSLAVVSGRRVCKLFQNSTKIPAISHPSQSIHNILTPNLTNHSRYFASNRPKQRSRATKKLKIADGGTAPKKRSKFGSELIYNRSEHEYVIDSGTRQPSSHKRVSVRQKRKQRKAKLRKKRIEEEKLARQRKSFGRKKAAAAAAALSTEENLSAMAEQSLPLAQTQIDYIRQIFDGSIANKNGIKLSQFMGRNILFYDTHIIALNKINGLLTVNNEKSHISPNGRRKRQSQLQMETQTQSRFDLDLQSILQYYLTTVDRNNELSPAYLRSLLSHNTNISAVTDEIDSDTDESSLQPSIFDKFDDMSAKLSHSESNSTDKKVSNKGRTMDGRPLPYIGTIHRLDRCTSGVVLYARHPNACTQMNALFSERKVKKTYIAIVKGVPHWDEQNLKPRRTTGVLEHYLASHSRYPAVKIMNINQVKDLLAMRNKMTTPNGTNHDMTSLDGVGDIDDGGDPQQSAIDISDANVISVTKSDNSGQFSDESWPPSKERRDIVWKYKYCRLKYRILETFEYNSEIYSVLKIDPTTGRQHQIRAQLSYEGYPIVGDRKYKCGLPFVTDNDLLKPSMRKEDCRTNLHFWGETQNIIALHAWLIEYNCPFTGELKSIEAPFPPHWAARFGPQITTTAFDHVQTVM